MKTLMAASPKRFPEKKMRAGRDLFTGESPYEMRRVQYNAKEHKQLNCASFIVYRKRIRTLRKHMNDCKPNDFWGVIYDRRNKMQYYTFWCDIAVGFLSMLPALISLAVSIARAVFMYRAPSLPTYLAIMGSNSTIWMVHSRELEIGRHRWLRSGTDLQHRMYTQSVVGTVMELPGP